MLADRCVLYLGDVERRFFSERGGGSGAGDSVTSRPPARHDNDTLQLTFSSREEDSLR